MVQCLVCTQRSAGPLLAAANPCGAVACPATASSPRRGDPGAAAAVQKDPVNSVPSNKMAVIVDHGPHGKYGLSPNRMVPFTPAGDGHTLRRPGADTTGGRDPQSCALGRREWIPPQSELIRAVMLEDSPYLPCGPWSLCSQTHRCVRLCPAVSGCVRPCPAVSGCALSAVAFRRSSKTSRWPGLRRSSRRWRRSTALVRSPRDKHGLSSIMTAPISSDRSAIHVEQSHALQLLFTKMEAQHSIGARAAGRETGTGAGQLGHSSGPWE